MSLQLPLSTWVLLLVALTFGPLALWLALRKPATAQGGRSRARSVAEAAGGPDPTPEARAAVAAALSDASAALQRGEEPREIVVRLYVALVRVLQLRVGDMSCATAEEIRQGHLVPLGVPEPTSQTLTRLFETARYSNHLIDSKSVDVFGRALRSAEGIVRPPGIPR